MPQIPIDSPSDPRVADYRAIRARQQRTRAGEHPAHADPTVSREGEFANGTFLAEGELVVRLLLKSRFAVRSIFLTETRYDALAGDLAALPPDVPIFIASPGVMSGVVGFDIHRGVLASANRGAPTTVPDLLASTPRGLVLLEDLTNADNVGSIFRNVAALAPGFAIVLSPGCCDPLYRKAIRVSMGHILRVPFALSTDWGKDLTSICSAGYTLIALDVGEGALDLATFRPTSPPAFLAGTEGAGVSDLARGAAHARVTIPMAPGVDSLNVGVATAIALHRLA